MRTGRKKGTPGSRLRVATLAGGLVVLLGAGVGIANAGEQGEGEEQPSSSKVLQTPQIDPERARQAAIDHLVSLGVPRNQATLRIQKQSGQVRAAATLLKQAPASVQSVWIDDNGTLMTSVLDEAGEKAARAAGATPKRAIFSTEDLETARSKLVRDLKENPPSGLSGASFSIDPASGKLVAEYLFTDADPVVPAAARGLGDMVTTSAEQGSADTHEDVDIAGSTMSRGSDGGKCTAAFAVDIADPNGGVPFNGVMTAGHCFRDGAPTNTKFDIDTFATGNTQSTGEFFSFGVAGDYGYLRLDRDRGSTKITNPVGSVVEAIEEPVVGATVCMTSVRTRETCGEIDRVNVTTVISHFGRQVELKGMVQAAYCSEEGTSGAPVYMDFDQAKGPLGVAALGVDSSGTTTFFGRCLGAIGDRNVAWFTPLASIDNQDKFFVRIDGG